MRCARQVRKVLDVGQNSWRVKADRKRLNYPANLRLNQSKRAGLAYASLSD